LKVSGQIVIEERNAVGILEQVTAGIASAFVQADQPAGFPADMARHTGLAKKSARHTCTYCRMHGLEAIIIFKILTAQAIRPGTLDVMGQSGQAQSLVR